MAQAVRGDAEQPELRSWASTARLRASLASCLLLAGSPPDVSPTAWCQCYCYTQALDVPSVDPFPALTATAVPVLTRTTVGAITSYE